MSKSIHSLSELAEELNLPYKGTPYLELNKDMSVGLYLDTFYVYYDKECTISDKVHAKEILKYIQDGFYTYDEN